MRIGIDIDGVLVEIEDFEFDYAGKYYYEQGIPLKNPFGYGSINMFQVSKERDDIFWSNAIYEYLKKPARKFASEVLMKLKEDNNELFIITARTSDLTYCKISKKQMEKIVYDWLRENNITYDQIIFTQKQKLNYILENNIDIMIEDKPKNIIDISKHIPVIAYNALYNQNLKGKNIIRGYSWYDIYSKIKDLKKD